MTSSDDARHDWQTSVLRDLGEPGKANPAADEVQVARPRRAPIEQPGRHRPPPAEVPTATPGAVTPRTGFPPRPARQRPRPANLPAQPPATPTGPAPTAPRTAATPGTTGQPRTAAPPGTAAQPRTAAPPRTTGPPGTAGQPGTAARRTAPPRTAQPPTTTAPRPQPPQPTPDAEHWSSDGLLGTPPHGDPWHRRLRASVRAMAGPAAKAGREATELAYELTAPVTTGRRIAVLGIRGGAGKSTVSSLLVSAYATHRRDRVLAVDADPDLGSLGLRLGSNSPLSLAGLGRSHRTWQDFAEVERYLARAGSGAWVLAADRSSATPGAIAPTAYLGVLHGIGRYFAVSVVDAGAGLATRLNLAMLTDAHAIVLAAPASVDGLLSTRRALDWIRAQYPHRLPRTVVALTAMSRQTASIVMRRATEALAQYGVTPELVPYDRHLATGTTIDPRRLGEDTQTAAVRVAAAALGRARKAPPPAPEDRR